MKTKWLLAGIFGAVFALAQACGGDDDDSNPAAGTGGSTTTATGGSGATGGGGGAAGTATSVPIKDGTNLTFGAECEGKPPFSDQNCLNIYCPANEDTPPLKEAGDCCKRVDLVKYNADKPANEKVYEYRLMSVRALTQLNSSGQKTPQDLLQGFQDKKAFVTLYRFTGDLSKEGPLKYTIGPGVYNCDGTYSFYAKGAAPATAWSSDADRYAPTSGEVTWKTEGYVDTALESLPKGVTYQGLYDYSKADWPVAYELPNQGFNPLKLPIAPDKPDCMGSRSEGTWNNQASLETYLRVDISNKINNLVGSGNLAQTLCQVMAFSLLKSGEETTKTCTMDRCDPADASCAWKDLPDALCPLTADEEKISPCHLGDKKKGDKLMEACKAKAYTDEASASWCNLMSKWPESPCSNKAPTNIKETPQCCDPLGKDTTIPMCNAWRAVYSVTASSVEITDTAATAPQKNCSKK